MVNWSWIQSLWSEVSSDNLVVLCGGQARVNCETGTRKKITGTLVAFKQNWQVDRAKHEHLYEA